MRKFCLAVILSLTSFVASAGRQWEVLENHWFHTLTDADSDRALELVEEMDRFRIAIQKITNAAMPADAPPALVIIFASAVEFRKYSWGRETGGFALLDEPGFPGITIVVPARGTTKDELQTIRHEYVHVLNKYRLVRFPRWYEEGIAEVLSLVKIEGANITVGLPPEGPFRGGLLVETGRSFDDIVSGKGPLDNNPRTFLFDPYRRYWVLAHYLTYGRPDLKDNLNRCLVLSDGMMEPLPAFRTAFGMTPAEMWTTEMKQYAGKMPTRRYTLKSPIVAEPFASKPADPAEVQSVLKALRDRIDRLKSSPAN